MEAIRKQTSEVLAISNELHIDLNDDEADRAQEEELGRLVEEAESLLEIEQKVELRRLCNSTPQHSQPPTVDLTEKMRLSLLLHRAQMERRDMVRDVVKHLSVAGMGEKQGQYKALIAKAIGEREEDVENMLPEILRELEDVETQERAELESTPS